MLKIFFMMLFMIPLVFNNKFWMIQFMIFFLSFMFMFWSKSYSYYFENLSYFMGIDIISFGLIMLTLWICSLMYMSSEKIYKYKFNLIYFNFMVLILMIFLFLTFSSMNLFMFYFFFESSLIPVLFLILGWGYQVDRIQAGLYLLFYTLLASLPLLMGIFYIYSEVKFLFIPMFFMMKSSLNFYFYLVMILAFLVKMPMYLVHLWLPKAHVEAPISGSMILAGILLKLGGYGLIRIFSLIFLVGIKFNYIFIMISMLGGVFVSLMCLFQFDLKSLIAYSSVVHMSLVICGIMTFFCWGVNGSYLMMISHGLCSSGLFCLANIMYERLGSRSMFINKGLLNFMPSMSLWWFLLCICNMAAPPSLNLMSEIILINSMVSWSNLSMLILIFLSFFSALYSLYLYSYTQHGELSLSYNSFSQGNMREFILLILHWFPLNMFIINVEFLLIL